MSKKRAPRCPVCGKEPQKVQERMAEMPPDMEKQARVWKRIGRTYHHPGGKMCDEPLAEVRDVVRRD